MDVVWIKLNSVNGHIEAHMFGTGGVVKMSQHSHGTTLSSSSEAVGSVQETTDEIMALIGAARNGVKVAAES